MKKCVIIGAVKISNIQKIRGFLSDSDFFIYCDAGLKNQEIIGCKPNLVIGDFDSCNKPQNIDCEIITLPCEKDDTDSFFAAKKAVEMGFTEIIMLGVLGGRIDHTMANLSALQWLFEQGVNAKIIDDYSCIVPVNNNPFRIKKDACRFFSVISVNGDICGLTIKGAKYPLDNAFVKSSYLYSVSNQVAEDSATVTVKNGNAFVVMDFQ